MAGPTESSSPIGLPASFIGLDLPGSRPSTTQASPRPFTTHPGRSQFRRELNWLANCGSSRRRFSGEPGRAILASRANWPVPQPVPPASNTCAVQAVAPPRGRCRVLLGRQLHFGPWTPEAAGD